MLILCFWLLRAELWGSTTSRVLRIKSLPGSWRKIPFHLYWLQSWTIDQDKGQGAHWLQPHLQHPELWSCRKCLETLSPASLEKPKEAGMGWDGMELSFPTPGSAGGMPRSSQAEAGDATGQCLTARLFSGILPPPHDSQHLLWDDKVPSQIQPISSLWSYPMALAASNTTSHRANHPTLLQLHCCGQ